jgi:hypothetical protein
MLLGFTGVREETIGVIEDLMVDAIIGLNILFNTT